MTGTEDTQKYPTMPELKRVTDIGFPILAMSLVGYLKNMISVVCMGRLGSLELAGGALAIGFTNITGYSVLSGLATGMEPLCSQAYGSRNFSLLSLTLQRTILMLLFASLPIGLLWLYLEPLMLILHQSPDVTQVASLYCKFALPDLVANSLLHPLRIFLRNKGITWPLMWCSLLAILMHLPITILLAFTLSLGVQGIAISTSITNFITLLFLLCYMYFTQDAHPDKPLCKPLSSPAHQASPHSMYEEWTVLLKLSIPSCAAVCLEWWWYEFMTISAGYLSNPRETLGTSAIVIQTTSLMYTLPTALSASVSTRVGNELGSGRPKKAHLAAATAVRMALISSLFGLLLTTLGREPWGRLFTEDKEILRLTISVLPIIGLCEVANCPQTTSCGILRGCARPGIGAAINFYSFYIIGAPVALYLAFVRKLGFIGLCYGLLAAQIACAVSILTVVLYTDWERESLKARDLVGTSNNDDDDDVLHEFEEGYGFSNSK